MEQPFVSILLPIHNAGKTIRLALESLVSQSYTNFEIIAIDDASTDDSYHIVKQLAKTDKRIRATRNTKRYGLSVCLTRALKLAKGDYVAFMDAHDISHKERLTLQVQYLQNNPKVIVLGAQCHFMHPETSEKSYSQFPQEHWGVYQTLFAGLSMQPETAMINRAILPKDVLKFEGTCYRFLPRDRRLMYVRSLMRLLPFGEFANLSEVLYTHRSPQGVQSIISFIHLWIKSSVVYDYQPSLRVLFSPFFNPTLLQF